MRKIQVAVCDVCDDYRDRFVAYLVEHKAKEMDVQAFSEAEIFLKLLGEKTFDIAILGQGFETILQEIKECGQTCVLLKDTVPEQLSEEDCYGMQEETKVSEIFRYQPIETILHEVQALSGAGHIAAEAVKCMPHLEVVGVCSPVRHEMQMLFSLVLAATLSERKKVLYVNLMEHSGFLELFDLTPQYDMGDIIVRLRNHRLTSETFLRGVYEMEGFFYIAPFSNPESLYEMTMEDYTAFLKFLETKTDFDTVVFDFGEGIAQLPRMLELCTGIYCLSRQGFFFDCQSGQFLKYLEQSSQENLREKMHMMELPFSARYIRGGTGVLRQLLWSEFGDYVRKYLTGADYEDR